MKRNELYKNVSFEITRELDKKLTDKAKKNLMNKSEYMRMLLVKALESK